MAGGMAGDMGGGMAGAQGSSHEMQLCRLSTAICHAS